MVNLQIIVYCGFVNVQDNIVLYYYTYHFTLRVYYYSWLSDTTHIIYVNIKLTKYFHSVKMFVYAIFSLFIFML